MSECKEFPLCPLCGKAPIVGNESCRCGTLCCPLCDKHVRLAIWQTRPVEDGLRAEIEKLESALVDMMKLGINRVKDLRAENDALKAALRELRESQYRKHYAHFNLTCNGCQALYGEDCAPDCPWAAAGKLLEEE